MSHPWLRRKSPIQIRKTPTVVKIEASPSELDLAKDNLKFFVERWNEHPNSPYIFDTSCQTISPCVSFNNIQDRRSSRTPSLSGYSPSPCDSISSLVEGDFSESPPPLSPRRSFIKSGDLSPTSSPRNLFLDRLQIFDRRASDSSYLARHAIEAATRINLAEEIRKLSDKLLKTNSSQDIIINNNNNDDSAFNFDIDGKNSFKSKINKKYSKSESQSFDENFELTFANSSLCYSNIASGFKTMATDVENYKDKFIFKDWLAPKRKYKFSNRDIPIHQTSIKSPSTLENENLSDTSSTLSSAGHSNPSTPDLFLDTPDFTKNLFHMFGKCENETTTNATTGTTTTTKRQQIRRTSLTVNYSDIETLSERTKKSLMNFFDNSKKSD